MPTLTDPWALGGRTLENRLVLAPLAGIGNWFVRLQAKRFGAGLVTSEMVSSFGLAYGNERTAREFLRIHPEEHPVAIQLFGHDADVMRERRAMAAAAGADLIDLNMGCPVRKVCKTGAGAALLDDPDQSGGHRDAAPRGQRPPRHGEAAPRADPRRSTGLRLAQRLATKRASPGSASTPGTPRSSTRARPTTRSPPSWWTPLPVPVILSGGLSDDEPRPRAPSSETGAAAVMLARGSLGNPWRSRAARPARGEPSAERGRRRARWVIGPRRGPPRRRARRPLPAQVLSLVRRRLGLTKARQRPSSRPHDGPCARLAASRPASAAAPKSAAA